MVRANVTLTWEGPNHLPRTYMSANGDEVAQNPSKLSIHGANVPRAYRHLNLEQLLDSQRKALLLDHRGPVVEAVKVREGLKVRFVLYELLSTAVQQANMGIDVDRDLTVQLQHQAEHAMRGRVLRAHVQAQSAHRQLLLDGSAEAGQLA